MRLQSLAIAVLTLALTSVALRSQVPIDVHPVTIFEILDPFGARLGRLVVAGAPGRGYQEGTESWRFSERALVEIGEQESLEFSVWAEGSWDDPGIVEALVWEPEDVAVEWVHPTEADWTSGDEDLPPMGGTYFGDPTIGGLIIQYSRRGSSSLTWFKLTEGPFMSLEDGAVLSRQEEVPGTGSWWSGPI